MSNSESDRTLGAPREHHLTIDSTNRRARELATAGATHGTLVTAAEQTGGRGRQGRAWSSPPGTSLSMSLILRDPPALPSLAAGVAVAETVEELLRRASAPTPAATSIPATTPFPADNPILATNPMPTISIKWPNDVLLDGRKVAGILVEGMPQQQWAVLGIGINVALRPEDLPPELAERATTLGLTADAIEPALSLLLRALERWLAAGDAEIVAAVSARDALHGQRVSWAAGALHGTADGIDPVGRLLVSDDAGVQHVLDAGEVHLERQP